MPVPDPLDILLPPMTELLEKTANVLEAKNIEHGPLTLLADVSQNVAITDQRSVFVKVYRRKDGLFEARNTKLARQYGAATPALLAETNWCSIWEHVRLEPLPLSALTEIMANVRTVHENTRGLKLIEAMDYDVQDAVVQGRLKKVPNHPLTPFVSNLTQELCSDLAHETEGEDLVFTHSDLQLKNMGMGPNGPLVFDWEICKMAPVELELSKLEENLFTSGDWTETYVEDVYGRAINRDLLHLATQLRYAQNIAFHLERHEEEVAQRQFNSLMQFQALL